MLLRVVVKDDINKLRIIYFLPKSRKCQVLLRIIFYQNKATTVEEGKGDQKTRIKIYNPHFFLTFCCHLSPPSRVLEFFLFWFQKINNIILIFCCHLSPPSRVLEKNLISVPKLAPQILLGP